MKGSAVILIWCFALFFTAPSHSFSVKFISEDDQIANRQDTLSGDPSPVAATTGNAIGSENSDTSTDESKTIKMDDGDTESGDESVPVDAPMEKSNRRKRDTRSLVRDMMLGTEQEKSPPMGKDVALSWLDAIGYNTLRCFQVALKDLEKHELPNDSDMSQGGKVILTRSEVISWLKFIQGSVSECLKSFTAPRQNGNIPQYHDDDTPVVAEPLPESAPVNEDDFMKFLVEIVKNLERCFIDIIKELEAKLVDQDQTDPFQRSSETVPDLLAELIEILAKIYGAAFTAGGPIQIHAQGQTVSPYPDGSPIITTTYKKRNSVEKTPGSQHPVISNLPGIAFDGSLPIILPPFFPVPGAVVDEPIPITLPSYYSVPGIPNSMLPKYRGFRGEPVQKPYPPVITTLPEEVNDPENPIPYFSLLDVVLKKIYSRLHGAVPATGSIGAQPVESLRGNTNGVLSLFRGPNQRPGMVPRDPWILDPDVAACIEECINKRAP